MGIAYPKPKAVSMVNAELRAPSGRRQGPPRAMVGWLRVFLLDLFPEAALPAAGSRAAPGRRLMSVAVQVAAVCLGAVVLLLRVPGVPAWDSLFQEDDGIFLVQAMQRPWHLLVPYNGYLQLVPRLVGQVAALLPLPQAPRVDAIGGALIAAACALFTYHASVGFIRSRWLRILLAATLILLPVAPLEIIDSAVNSVWYLLAALLWAIFWRPRTRAGIALAAVIAFATVASNVLALVLLPLLVLRAIALPRAREHAVTIGFLAGFVLQVPIMREASAMGQQRVSHLSKPTSVLGYYAHSVILRAPGWRLSWHLTWALGMHNATLIVGGFLALVFIAVLVTGDWQVRKFTAMALLTGLVVDYVGSSIDTYTIKWGSSIGFESAARYSTLPILLIEAPLIVAVDALITRRAARGRPERLPLWSAPTVASIVLVLGLSVGWVTDFRYATYRSLPSWSPTATSWIAACKDRTEITIPAWNGAKATVSCENVHS